MSITGINAITFGSTDLATCQQFFSDWGLTLVHADSLRCEFRTLNDSRVIVAHSDTPGLALGVEPDPTLREVTWGVQSGADLDRIAQVLAESPGFFDRTPDGLRLIGACDPNGLAVRFQVDRKHAVHVVGVPSNTWDSRCRVNQASTVYERAEPIDVGHVVFFVADLGSTQAFYEALGFVPSDRYPGRGTFLRCAPRRGHHDLFLLQTPDRKRGLNHVAFAVRDIHEVFGGGLHISRCGWETQLGPGRHPISSAYFWYVRNPAGALCEYYADADELTEAWQPRDFEPGPTVFAEWAIEGGIDGRTRRQQGRHNDGKFLTDRRP